MSAIGYRAFEGCSGLTGSLITPDSVTSIYYEAFSYCSGFKGNLTIGEFVVWIDSSAFDSFSGLTDTLFFNAINCSEKDYYYLPPFSVYMFSSLIIGYQVTKIPNGVFSSLWFSELRGNLIIPNFVTSIGNWSFSDCSGFTGSLVIPNSVS